MAKKGAENTKKVAGNARKAEQANKKLAEAQSKQAAEEDAEWSQGSKGKSKKKEDEAAKKEEAARKKAEREALLKEEEASLPSKPSNKNRGAAKIAARKTGKIDDFLNDQAPSSEISASGLDNVLEALTLTKKNGPVSDKEIDRHPERRFKAALAAYEERRIPEARKENPGLRLQQVKQLIFKEFEKSDENPFNQVTNVSFNADRDEVENLKSTVKKQREDKFVR
jgi:membrane protein involved in colicin uptake